MKSSGMNSTTQSASKFDGMGYVATTGYFDPKDDIESGESDSLTGYYYVEI